MSTTFILRAVKKLCRAAVTGLLLAALFVAGATAAKRSYLEDQKEQTEKAAPVVSSATELAAPAVSEEANGSMARGAHPTTEQVCVFQVGTTPAGNHSQNLRLRDGAPFDFCPASSDAGMSRTFPPATSLASAAPLTAATRTLVGAVPSGTM
ncbi:MAG: hypothetical protein HY851_08335 [candidate division Zixibacteria bacterium]|nr:hypothetical protein [candidate division Zixibacteria bacterium]